MPRRSALRPPVRVSIPSPPPGARSTAWSGAGALPPLPPLPMRRVGAAPARLPGAGRPVPQQGGILGVAIPPEVRRRLPRSVRAAPGAADAARRIWLALRKAQEKLLGSRRKLELNVVAMRALLASRK